MLTALSGRDHLVHTGLAVRRDGATTVEVATTTVSFRRLDPVEIDRYVATGEPRGRARLKALLLYGLGGVHVLDEGSRTFVFASGYRGVDVATDGRSDADRRLYGGRLGIQRALSGSIDWFASIAAQKSLYSIENPIFVVTRKDYQYDLNTGLNWQVERDWLLRPQMTYTRNDSNISLNDYDRYEFSVLLRRDFR